MGLIKTAIALHFIGQLTTKKKKRISMGKAMNDPLAEVTI